MNGNLSDLLKEIRTGLDHIYGRRLKGVYVYGSRARQDADSESDVDVLIVLDHVEDYFAEVDHTSHLNAELSLNYDVAISRVFVPEDEWRKTPTTFLRNARAEAVAA